MNSLTIIGNLTNDPELRTAQTGKNVCSFSVAVNRKRKVEVQPDADFFRISAWGDLGERCAKYLAKGRKVCVIGPVSVRTYETQKHETRANMEVMANEVEFLSPKSDSVDPESGYQKVDVGEELPY